VGIGAGEWGFLNFLWGFSSSLQLFDLVRDTKSQKTPYPTSHNTATREKVSSEEHGTKQPSECDQLLGSSQCWAGA
jgi:hypothetical protein